MLHVVQRGNNRAPVFVDDVDRHRFVDDLLAATRKHRVTVHAYVLMTNHVHVLATPLTPEALPRTMQTAGRRYVGRFNRVHSRTSTLWEGRYKATLYRWSRHRANACGAEDPLVTCHALYASLGGTAASRCDAYGRMFERELPEQELAAIRDATRYEWALAGEAFRQIAEALAGRRATRLPMGPRPRAPGG